MQIAVRLPLLHSHRECIITRFLKTLIGSRSSSQPFAGTCPCLQMVHFELMSIVRGLREEVERWEGKQDKLLGPYYLEGQGKISGKAGLVWSS